MESMVYVRTGLSLTYQIVKNLFQSIAVILINASKLWCTARFCSGALLFLIYINDLHKAIQYCKVQHFADDTNLFYTNKSVKDLNKLVNHDMKQLNNWLRANKISLDVAKTELVIFQSPRKVLSDEIKIKLIGKRLYSVKCSKISWCKD